MTNLWARLPGVDTDIPLALKEFAGEANAVAQSYRVTLVMTGPPPVDVLPGMNVTVYAERAMPNLYPQSRSMPSMNRQMDPSMFGGTPMSRKPWRGNLCVSATFERVKSKSKKASSQGTALPPPVGNSSERACVLGP